MKALAKWFLQEEKEEGELVDLLLKDKCHDIGKFIHILTVLVAFLDWVHDFQDVQLMILLFFIVEAELLIKTTISVLLL